MKEHILNKIDSLIGIPYKKDPPYSIKDGFNCFSFTAYMWDFLYNEKYVLKTEFSDLRDLLRNFSRLDRSTPLKEFDVPLFYNSTLGERHIGLMLNNKIMVHCSHATNGVALSDTNRVPWRNWLQGVYRRK